MSPVVFLLLFYAPVCGCEGANVSHLRTSVQIGPIQELVLRIWSAFRNAKIQISFALLFSQKN